MSPSVPEYYAGKSVFVTGATGFVGKALIEKLLRSCPDVGTVYILMRQKKGFPGEERLKELLNNQLFDLLKETNPQVFKKLKVICGDITEEEMGISDEDKRLLQDKCNVIFHSAACVRFDLRLKDAVRMNTTGTLRMLMLAETMNNLEAFVHLSTAYCRCHLDVLEEQLYPAAHKPRKVMDIVEWMDDDMLQRLEPKMIASEPNTYSYTKAITEDLVAEYADKFPIAIARPSIVIAAWKEPIPGWVDNLNGPTGLLFGSGKGVIRTMHCNPNYAADAVSVDVIANGCLLIGYVTALDRPRKAEIYNLTLSGAIKISWGEIIELGKKYLYQYPYSVSLWYPGGNITSYWLVHQFFMILTHLIPAYLVDALLFLLGQKTFMVNVQKRISHGLSILQYYTTKEWHFKNNHFTSLRHRITPKDNEIFYTDLTVVNTEEYLKNYVIGTRMFCAKEDASTLPRAKKLQTIRYIADVILKMVLFSLFAWFLYSHCYIFTSSVEFLDSTLKSIPPINQVRAEHENLM